jgi:hypothetical protein
MPLHIQDQYHFKGGLCHISLHMFSSEIFYFQVIIIINKATISILVGK